MRAAIFQEPRSITAGERPDATITEPADAVVRVVLACVCGRISGTTVATRRLSPGRSVTSSSAWSKILAARSAARDQKQRAAHMLALLPPAAKLSDLADRFLDAETELAQSMLRDGAKLPLAPPPRTLVEVQPKAGP
jgi:hypothetical protein